MAVQKRGATLVRGADGAVYRVSRKSCERVNSDREVSVVSSTAKIQPLISRQSEIYASARVTLDPGDHGSARVTVDPGDQLSARVTVDPGDHGSARVTVDPGDHLSARVTVDPGDQLSA